MSYSGQLFPENLHISLTEEFQKSAKLAPGTLFLLFSHRCNNFATLHTIPTKTGTQGAPISCMMCLPQERRSVALPGALLSIDDTIFYMVMCLYIAAICHRLFGAAPCLIDQFPELSRILYSRMPTRRRRTSLPNSTPTRFTATERSLIAVTSFITTSRGSPSTISHRCNNFAT